MPDDAMRIHATQDEIGCRVIVHNLKSRPALNRLAGTIVSLDHKPGGCRCGVRVDGQGEPLSLSRSNLMRERTPPWDNCRHGGPPLDPAMAAEFIMAASQLTAPTLGHVALLEPHVRKYAPPAVLFASYYSRFSSLSPPSLPTTHRHAGDDYSDISDAEFVALMDAHNRIVALMSGTTTHVHMLMLAHLSM